MKKERLKKSIKSGLVALVMGASSLTGGLCQDKSNAVKLHLKDSNGGTEEVFNFDITPDNSWFDKKGKAIVAKFQGDSSITGIWVNENERLELRTAIAKMVADQIKAKIGPVETWGNADDRKAKLFKILSLIYTECCRVYLRAGRDQEYENWITGDTPQDRLNLFWISWMAYNFIVWFKYLEFEPDLVDYDYNLPKTPSTVGKIRLRAKHHSLCDFYKQGLDAGVILHPTTISFLYDGFRFESYKEYFDRLINWNITDVSSSTKVSRWLNERLNEKAEICFRMATPKSLYPVVDLKYKGQKIITRDEFLNGDLLNLSNGNELIFEVLDDNVQVPQQKMSMSNPMVQKPQVKPAIRLQNKSNESKSKDFEVDYSKSYTLRFGRNGTPILEETE